MENIVCGAMMVERTFARPMARGTCIGLDPGARVTKARVIPPPRGCVLRRFVYDSSGCPLWLTAHPDV